MNLTYHPKHKRFEMELHYLQYRDNDEGVVDILRTKPSFHWDKINKVWFTFNPKIAFRLIDYATPDCAEMIQDQIPAEVVVDMSLVADSFADKADIDIPLADNVRAIGENYLPYQLAGIKYIEEHGNTLIGDEMGLGKTIEAIGWINLHPEIRRVLVICPATPKINWHNELMKWLVIKPSRTGFDLFSNNPWTIGIADAKTGYPGTDIVIINYDILHKYHIWLRHKPWDLLIVDESHNIRNQDTRRTREVIGFVNTKKTREKLGISKERAARLPLRGKYRDGIPAKRIISISGTPFINRVRELWTNLSFLRPDVWKMKSHFERDFCNAHHTRFGVDASGASNLERLQFELRKNVMIRRMKKDVLSQLKPKRRQVIELPSDEFRELIDRGNSLVNKNAKIVADLREAVRMAQISDDDTAYGEAVGKLNTAKMCEFTEMARIRHETALAKIPQVITHIKDCLESGKLVVFGWHHDLMNEIRDAFPGRCAMITGKTPVQDRQAEVERFQSDDKCRIFIGSITAAGTAITLTAASLVIFAELDWVPGNVTQAEDRLHRIGQKDQVLAQHLVLEGSIDARIAQVIVEKQEVIDKALNDQERAELATKSISISEV